MSQQNNGDGKSGMFAIDLDDDDDNFDIPSELNYQKINVLWIKEFRGSVNVKQELNKG